VIGLRRREAGVVQHRHREGRRVRAVHLPQRLDDEVRGVARVGAEAVGSDLVAQRACDPVDPELASLRVAEQVDAGGRGDGGEGVVDARHRRMALETGRLDLGPRARRRGDLGGDHRPPEGVAGRVGHRGGSPQIEGGDRAILSVAHGGGAVGIGVAVGADLRGGEVAGVELGEGGQVEDRGRTGRLADAGGGALTGRRRQGLASARVRGRAAGCGRARGRGRIAAAGGEQEHGGCSDGQETHGGHHGDADPPARVKISHASRRRTVVGPTTFVDLDARLIVFMAHR
jgi:hypothetical protein